jgi:glycerol kinase
MEQRQVLVIDEGTTGTRALVVDVASRVVGSACTEFAQHHPGPDRVEHDAEEIWSATRQVIGQALEQSDLAADRLAAVGITNQRATTVVWDRVTGEAITQLVSGPAETQALALAVPDNGGVYFVPALTGLSAPYWDSYARGTLSGISLGTKREHRAVTTGAARLSW